MDDSDPDEPTRTPDPGMMPHPGPELAPPAHGGARFAPGTVLAGRYRVVGLLGRGGMGEVYRAQDLRLQQDVALKLLPARVGSDPVRLARFHSEVRLARQVSHPGVCRVHDIGESDGLTFLSMEYVDGEDLASLLRRIGRFPADRAMSVARQICEGLGAAHDSGVLHRDLKPANVMIDGRGRARLTDFGLAVAVDETRRDGEIAGTPAYMAPEQIEGRELSQRTDVYALGLVLYELFTGRPAFQADGVGRVLELQRSSAPAPPSSHVPDLAPAVERTVLQCLEKDPARRPASARAVAVALGGGDALAAVIAAGETPSPEMVAAAGAEGTWSPGATLAAAAFSLAAFATAVTLHHRVALFNQIPFDKPPSVLAERARELVRMVDSAAAPSHEAMGFAYDRQLLAYLERNDRSPDRWDRLSSGRPAAVQFWYRQAPARLRPRHPFGVVGRRDPPPGPGEAMVVLDTQGRLLSLTTVPPALLPPPTAGAAPDWPRLLGEAGLDAPRLAPVAPERTPPVYAEARAAWRGAFPGRSEIPLHVEGAALRGQPVWFQVLGPWDEVGTAAGRAMSADAVGAVTTALSPLALVLAVVLARRNLRLGRGDRRGAWRLVLVVFACRMVYWLLGAGHDASLVVEWNRFEYGMGRALYLAALVGTMYVGLEPYVRRRWPQALISWTRVLSGQLVDPLVGRDVLVGTGMAVAAILMVLVTNLIRAWAGQPPPRLLELELDHLLGPGAFLARLANAPVMAILFATFALLLLLGLRVATRGSSLAAPGFVVVWTVVFVAGWGTGALAEVVLYGSMAALFAIVLVRFGLFALCVGSFLGLLEVPVTTRFSAWYATPGILACALVVGLVAFGAWASLRGRPVLARWLEDQ